MQNPVRMRHCIPNEQGEIFYKYMYGLQQLLFTQYRNFRKLLTKNQRTMRLKRPSLNVRRGVLIELRKSASIHITFNTPFSYLHSSLLNARTCVLLHVKMKISRYFFEHLSKTSKLHHTLPAIAAYSANQKELLALVLSLKLFCSPITCFYECLIEKLY